MKTLYIVHFKDDENHERFYYLSEASARKKMMEIAESLYWGKDEALGSLLKFGSYINDEKAIAIYVEMDEVNE